MPEVKFMLNEYNITLLDLELYTTQLFGGLNVLYNFLAIMIGVMSILIHKSTYRLLKRLGNRHINMLIIPSMVSIMRWLTLTADLVEHMKFKIYI